MSLEARLLEAFEVHSPDDIRAALDAGVSPIDPIKGKRPVDCLIEAYARSSQFPACLRVMRDAGATVGDSLIEAILLDDVEALRQILDASPSDVGRRLNVLVAYTSCRDVTPLHLCAEFNATGSARLLLDRGADVDARAGVGADRLGGQTPLFHAVNSNFNYCRPAMELLVEGGASLDLRVDGLLWGETFEWETAVFDVTPLSYAQCGLYAQFHRREDHVYDNVAFLYQKRFGRPAPIRNLPNRYLRRG